MISEAKTKRLLSVKEVADWLQVKEYWVRAHATKRRKPYLPCVQLGKTLRFDEQQTQEWLDSLTRQVG